MVAFAAALWKLPNITVIPPKTLVYSSCLFSSSWLWNLEQFMNYLLFICFSIIMGSLSPDLIYRLRGLHKIELPDVTTNNGSEKNTVIVAFR